MCVCVHVYACACVSYCACVCVWGGGGVKQWKNQKCGVLHSVCVPKKGTEACTVERKPAQNLNQERKNGLQLIPEKEDQP